MFGKLREILKLRVHKVLFLRKSGKNEYEVVKTAYFKPTTKNIKIGKGKDAKAFSVHTSSLAYGLKNTKVYFKDFDSDAFLRLNDKDYVISTTGQVISPEENELYLRQNAIRAIFSGSYGDLVWLLIGVVIGAVLGLALGVAFGDTIMNAIGST